MTCQAYPGGGIIQVHGWIIPHGVSCSLSLFLRQQEGRFFVLSYSPSIAFKCRLYRLGILMSQRYPNSERNSEIVAIPSR